VDGGGGLLAALPMVYPGIPVQRCWAHKIRNIVSRVKAADREAVKRSLHRIMNADNRVAARTAAGRFARRWGTLYPKAVASLRADLDELLACFRYTDAKLRKTVRTTNAIERRFREVRRRTRPMGVFADQTSRRPNLNGKNTVRCVHTRKPITRSQYPFSADTKLVTLTMMAPDRVGTIRHRPPEFHGRFHARDYRSIMRPC